MRPSRDPAIGLAARADIAVVAIATHCTSNLDPLMWFMYHALQTYRAAHWLAVGCPSLAHFLQSRASALFIDIHPGAVIGKASSSTMAPAW